MKKYSVLFFLLIAALAMTACSGGTTETVEPQPSASRGFAWEVREGEAWLTGIGKVTESDIWIPGQVRLVEGAEGWTEAEDDTSGVVYPVVVKGDAFKSCKQLTTVTFMDGVRIENDQMHGKKLGMFYKCTSLAAVYNIPDSVKSMRGTFEGCKALCEAPVLPSALVNMESAFEDCISLREPSVIPDSVTEMVKAFSGCASLERMPNLPSNVTDLTDCFRSCSSLIEISQIPSGVRIMNYCFSGCKALPRMPVLPEGVEEINGCFTGCSALVDVEPLPASVKQMKSVFKGCSALVTVPDIPEGIVELHSAFEDCASLLNAPRLPESVRKLTSTFKGCESLAVAPEIPVGVVDMESTFEGCSSLKITPYLPEAAILTYTFKDCTALERVTNFPGTESAYQTFANCVSLKEVLTVDAETSLGRGIDAFLNCSSLELITLDFCPWEMKRGNYEYLGAIIHSNVEFALSQNHGEGYNCEYCSGSSGGQFVDGVLLRYENASDLYAEWFIDFFDNEVPEFFKENCFLVTLTNDLGPYYSDPKTVNQIRGFATGHEAYIKITGSLLNMEYTVYHELGHCFDFCYNNAYQGATTILSDQPTGILYPYLSDMEEWLTLHEAEGNVACQWYGSLYWTFTEEEQRMETFAISVSKYFTDPDALKRRCPGMYEYMDNLFRPMLEAESEAKAEAEAENAA